MRLRLEFTTEPFDLDEVPGHARAAREVMEEAGFDTVDVGPFGNTAEGQVSVVLPAVSELLERAIGAGATCVTFQVNVLGGPRPGPDPGPGPGPDPVLRPDPARAPGTVPGPGPGLYGGGA